MTNIVIGLLAVFPTALLMSLLASDSPPQTNHTYGTVAGRHPLFEVDGDEAGVVGLLVVGVAAALLLVFVAANAVVARRRPAGMTGIAVWCLALTTSVLPSIGLMIWVLGA
jgi:hypothetical protein